MSEKEVVLSRLKERQKLNKAHAQITRLFIMTSFLIFITILFIGIVKHIPDLKIPFMYKANSGFIIISSILIFIGEKRIKTDQLESAYKWILFGFAVGFIFGAVQLVGLGELLELNEIYQNVLFPASIIHFLHLIVGLLFLVKILHGIKDYKVHSKSIGFAKNVFYFWHFLGLIWIFLMLSL